MHNICQDDECSAQLASLIRQRKLVLTVHHKLPSTHSKSDVQEFESAIDCMAKCQKNYGLLSIISFDVPQNIRDDVLPYIRYVLQYEQFPKVAVEDFGLTQQERIQIEPLKGNKRFGYLIDIEHMYLRI